MSFFSKIFGSSPPPEFRECTIGGKGASYDSEEQGGFCVYLDPDDDRFDEETEDCTKCEREINETLRHFPQPADRTAYIANRVLPEAIRLMGATTEAQKKQIKESVSGIFSFDDFLARLQIVLQGVSNWDDKLKLIAALHPCHTPPADFQIIDFPNLRLVKKLRAINLGVDHLPREYYKNLADFQSRNPQRVEQLQREQTPAERRASESNGWWSDSGVGTFT